MLEIDLSESGPKFALPQLLTHPQIPGQLSGINPRTILGKEWWDEQRSAAYKGNNSHCWACGRRSNKSLLKHALEAHETYDIDSRKGLLKFMSVVALCSDCHTYIHSGRLYAEVERRRIKKKDAKYILRRGSKLLKENGLHPYWATRTVELVLLDDLLPLEAKRKAIGELRDRSPELVDRYLWPAMTWYMVYQERRYGRLFGSYYSEFDKDGKPIGERRRIPTW